MLQYSLADVALDAAADFDALRLGKDVFRDGVPRFLSVMREALPAGETSITGRVTPRDVLLAKEVLERVVPASRQLVREVVADLHAWMRDVESAWAERRHDHKYVEAFLTWSKIAAARLGRSGHTLTADCRC